MTNNSSDSVENYRTLFEGVPVALYRTAPDGTLMDINPALARMLGYPDRETLMGVNAADVYVDPADRLRWRQLLDREGDGTVFEMRDRRRDGSIIWVRDRARAVRDDSDRVLWYEGTLEEVGAPPERRAADPLETFRGVECAPHEALWEWDLDSGRVRWSESLEEVFGHVPSDIGPGIEHVRAWRRAHLHPDDRERATSAFDDAMARGARCWTFNCRFRRADGRYAAVLDHGCVARGERGHPVRLVGVLTDLDRLPAGTNGARGAGLPLPGTPDERLLEWAAGGDELAFTELYIRHSPDLYAVLRRRVDNDADVEDLVAETFIQAWRLADRFDRERGTLGAWLTRIGLSRAMDRWRRSGRRRALAEAAPVASRSTISSPEEEILAADAVDALVQRLPASQRRMIELAFLRGLSHSEIAADADVPLGTVKTRIRTALRRMRDDGGMPAAG